jgi:CheY-like chemotaxis protein
MAPRPDADRVDARTVLLADDDEDFRAVLAETLAESGHEVIAVPNGAAALTLLEDAARGRARPWFRATRDVGDRWRSVKQETKTG